MLIDNYYKKIFNSIFFIQLDAKYKSTHLGGIKIYTSTLAKECLYGTIFNLKILKVVKKLKSMSVFIIITISII
jgi:hypothetical protein